MLELIFFKRNAFSNIYNLLTNGGDCLLMFLGQHTVYDVGRELSRAPRWNCWLRDVDHYVSPYHDFQDLEMEIKIMMTNIGFTNMEVKCLQKIFIYTGKDVFQNAMNAINPFKIPLEMQEDFLEDFVKVVRDMGLVDHTNENVDGTFEVKMKYKLVIVCGKK